MARIALDPLVRLLLNEINMSKPDMSKATTEQANVRLTKSQYAKAQEMTDEQKIRFLNARLWCLKQTDGWPSKRLEFAGDQGQLLWVEGGDIREMIEDACSQTDFLVRGA